LTAEVSDYAAMIEAIGRVLTPVPDEG